MDPEEHKMLEKLLVIAEQTNRVVRRMRHEVLIMRFIHIFYLLFIVGAAFAGYHFIQPYLVNIFSVIDNIKSIQLPK